MKVSLIVAIIFATCGLIGLMHMRTKDKLSVTNNYLRKLMTLYLGNKECIWKPPNYEPDPGDYFRSLLVGYPGGAKRVIYSQIEAMTGLAFNDEAPSPSNNVNRPFTKANYPHHEGMWGFGSGQNQVILVMRNPMKAMIEYHDVLNDIDVNSENPYALRPSVESWREWRDLRVPAEIQWYGWFIDYWMEGGLLRDIQTHELATSEYWNKMYISPEPYYESGQAYMGMAGEGEEIAEAYDLHCIDDMPEGSCEPAVIVSAERAFQETTGPTEMLKIAAVLGDKPGIEVIDHEALECVWDELMVEKKGIITMFDRAGASEDEFKFKLPYLTEMLSELFRLRTKYNGPEWATQTTAMDLVTILDEYIDDVNAQIEFGNYE